MKIAGWIILVTALICGIGSVNASFLPLNGTYYTGDTLFIQGDTNYNTDNSVLLEIYPLSFGPTKKWESSMSGGTSVIIPVISSGDRYEWSANISTEGWAAQNYMARAEVISKDYQETATFTLAEKRSLMNGTMLLPNQTEGTNVKKSVNSSIEIV